MVNQISSQDDDQTVCTQDVKECPDGSFVSRMGLSCDFALCPDDVSNRYMIDDLGYEIEKRTTSKKTEYNTYYINNLQIDILDIIEDSRCLENTQCVWQGTVIVKALVTLGTSSVNTNLELAKTINVLDKKITMIDAGERNNYNFKFYVE